MQSSRDSSVLRSLAVAFGDGLAFGVGMKLSQNAAKPVLPPAAANLAPIADRLAQIEGRVQKMEQAPALIAAPGSVPQRVDQQVLEAVVQAVEARLKEQSVQVDRRFADIEARVTLELKAIHDDIHILGATTETRFREIGAESRSESAAIRREVKEQLADAERRAASVEEIVRNGIAAAQAGMRQEMESMRADLVRVRADAEQGIGTARSEAAAAGEKAADAASTLETRIASALEAGLGGAERRLIQEVHKATGGVADAIIHATEATIEHRLGPLEAALAEKDSTITDLKAAARSSEQQMRELLLTIGAMCSEAARRFAAAGPESAFPAVDSHLDSGPPHADSPGLPDAEPPAEPPPGVPDSIAARNAGPAELVPVPQMNRSGDEAAEEAPETAAPLFAQEKASSRVWRIPLVSSFLMAGAGCLMMYYF
jgi:hypothetical protein